MKINLTIYRYLFATIIIPMGYHLPIYHITSLHTSLPYMQQTLPTLLHLLTFLHRSLEMKLNEKLINVSLLKLVVSNTVCYRNVFGELLSFSSILQKTPGYNTMLLLLLLVTRPLPRNGGMAEDHGAPEAGQLPRAWTRGRTETESRQRVSGAKST